MRNTLDGFRVVIEDDGKGYDESALDQGMEGDHIGRDVMTERAKHLNAVLHLESEPGEGTAVILEASYSPSNLSIAAVAAPSR